MEVSDLGVRGRGKPGLSLREGALTRAFMAEGIQTGSGRGEMDIGVEGAGRSPVPPSSAGGLCSKNRPPFLSASSFLPGCRLIQQASRCAALCEAGAHEADCRTLTVGGLGH